MTAETRRRWKAACQAVQALNDRLLLDTDWSAVDWRRCGLEQPTERASAAALAPSLGGCQLPSPPGVKPAGFSHYLHREVPGLAFGWGGFPEAHSVEHSGERRQHRWYFKALVSLLQTFLRCCSALAIHRRVI